MAEGSEVSIVKKVIEYGMLEFASLSVYYTYLIYLESANGHPYDGKVCKYCACTHNSLLLCIL